MTPKHPNTAMCLAIPGQIVDMPAVQDQPMASVEVSGVRRKVNIDLLREDGLTRDDWVLIHVGFAMSKISEEEARDQLRLLETLGETEEAMDEVRGYGSTGGGAPGGPQVVDPLGGKNPFADDGGGTAGGDGAPERSPPAPDGGPSSSRGKPLEDP